MPRDKSNSIRIFWIEKDKEKSVRIYPKNIPEKKWENGTELYIFGLTEVCRYFNCSTPESLHLYLGDIRWCYDYLPPSDINNSLTWAEQCEKIFNTDAYRDWYLLKREFLACRAADSMFSDAYYYLIKACQAHKRIISDAERHYENVHELLINKDWKEPYWVMHLFDDYIGFQNSYIPHGAWLFRDGSYITVESGCHRRIVEGYMNMSERDVEKYWVKIQMGWIYSHHNMSDAQKKVINKFLSKYEDLHESDRLWNKK